MKITPENIVKRHNKYPEGTVDLIEYYANMKVYSHVNRLLKYSSISHIPTNGTVIIISEHETWNDFKTASPFAGLDVNTIEEFTKQIK